MNVRVRVRRCACTARQAGATVRVSGVLQERRVCGICEARVTVRASWCVASRSKKASTRGALAAAPLAAVACNRRAPWGVRRSCITIRLRKTSMDYGVVASRHCLRVRPRRCPPSSRLRPHPDFPRLTPSSVRADESSSRLSAHVFSRSIARFTTAKLGHLAMLLTLLWGQLFAARRIPR